MALEATTWSPAWQMFSMEIREAAWPEEVSIAPTPPSRAANLLFHSVHGGVAQTGIEEALGLQVKEVAHGLGAVIGIRCALHNGHHPGLPVAGMIAFLVALVSMR